MHLKEAFISFVTISVSILHELPELDHQHSGRKKVKFCVLLNLLDNRARVEGKCNLYKQVLLEISTPKLRFIESFARFPSNVQTVKAHTYKQTAKYY
jgi:CRISPR/Cas system endoribonuclease Cas6 (RAMP superfamily)